MKSRPNINKTKIIKFKRKFNQIIQNFQNKNI